MSGQSVGRGERLDRLAVKVVSHGIRLGAREIIALRMDECSDGTAQFGSGDIRFQKRPNFVEEADSERSDRITRSSREDSDRANEQSVDRFCLSEVGFCCRDWSTANGPRFVHVLTSFCPPIERNCEAMLTLIVKLPAFELGRPAVDLPSLGCAAKTASLEGEIKPSRERWDLGWRRSNSEEEEGRGIAGGLRWSERGSGRPAAET